MSQQSNAEVDALLDQARRHEDRGDFHSAVRRYQAAISLLPADDPRREQIQSAVDFITQTQFEDEIAENGDPGQSNARRIAIPLWLWAIAGLGILLAFCILAAGAYFLYNRQAPPIPRLSGLAPTREIQAPTPTELGAAPAPTFQVTVPSQLTPFANATPVIPAQSSGRILFQESFDAVSLDPARWQVDNSAGTQIRTGGGALSLASSASHEPYIHTIVNPFPATGNFHASLRFRFPDVGTCGTAIAMTSFPLPAGKSQSETNQLSRSAELAGGVSIWFWHSVVYYRSGPAFEDIAIPGRPADWRDVAVEYSDSVYHILVNGNSVFTSPPTDIRPTVLWMGLPFDLGGSGCAWDSLQVAQIQVLSLP